MSAWLNSVLSGVTSKPDPQAREASLREAAARALRWFDHRIQGTGLNGMHDDITIARDLCAALERYTEDDAPMRDALMDRR